MENIPYREAIGSLMCAAVATRPDVAFAVSTLSKFLDIHWEAVKRVFRHLAGAKDYAETSAITLQVSPTPTELKKNIATPFQATHFSWTEQQYCASENKKQELITLSTASAEYVATMHAAKECIWLRRFMNHLFGPAPAPTTLYCDNQTALHLAAEDNYHARTYRQQVSLSYYLSNYC
jgi:hypothetical protein